MCAHYFRSVRFPIRYRYLLHAYRTWPDDNDSDYDDGSGCYCFTLFSVHKSLSAVPPHIHNNNK